MGNWECVVIGTWLGKNFEFFSGSIYLRDLKTVVCVTHCGWYFHVFNIQFL